WGSCAARAQRRTWRWGDQRPPLWRLTRLPRRGAGRIIAGREISSFAEDSQSVLAQAASIPPKVAW
ncbi:MAG: hypothetical protein ACK56F_10745, partial [bacterium]